MLDKLKTFFTGKPAIPGKGGYYEARARRYLKQQGLTDFQSNFHSRRGEIDLIARDGAVLVFVEVRYRQSIEHGSPLATVTFYKQQKIRQTARHYLQINGLTNRIPCRFDVIGITGSGRSLEYQWIKNAF